MTRHALLARRLVAMLGASLLFTLVAAPAVSAGRPIAGNVVVQPVTTRTWEIDPGPPAKFDSVRLVQTVPGVVDVIVQVEHANSVQLAVTDYTSLPAGIIALLGQTSDNGIDTYHYRVTGLTPTAIYDFQIAATGTLATAYVHGQVKG